MSSKLLLSRKNGKPRTGSARPSEGVACATNAMEADCADTCGANATHDPKRNATANQVFFMPLILADASRLRCRWVQMVNGGGERPARSADQESVSVELERDFDDLSHGR